MKKFSLLIYLFVILFLPNIVKAESITCNYNNDIQNDLNKLGNDNINSIINGLLDQYETIKNNYPYYSILFYKSDSLSPTYDFFQLVAMNKKNFVWHTTDHTDGSITYNYMFDANNTLGDSDYQLISASISFDNSGNYDSYEIVNFSVGIFPSYLDYNTLGNCYISDNVYYSNFDVKFEMLDNYDEIYVQDNFNSENYSVLSENSNYTFSNLQSILNYNLPSNVDKYRTVNLDDYYYVLLSLKDYSKKKAFSSNLKVKGMVGITPIYNYGTTEKDVITDRCNLSYDDFTDYRLYILDQDLKNKAIYAVKKCKNGSSFKYDSSVFNITYVTDDNKNDPVVTIDGKEYHTIPFDSLSNSANKNEENDFVPGESEPATFSSVVSNISDTLEGVWNTLTTFMSLVTRFFRTLPSEFQAVAITSFTVMCTLGIIKFIKG